MAEAERSERENVIRRIIALAQISPDNATAGEAENALRLGRRLIAKHQIVMGEVAEVEAKIAREDAALRGRRAPEPAAEPGVSPRPPGWPDFAPWPPPHVPEGWIFNNQPASATRSFGGSGTPFTIFVTFT